MGALSLPARLERVVLFLTEAGHTPDHALAMAGNMFGVDGLGKRERLTVKRHRGLRMTPDELATLAGRLEARKVVAEGMLLRLADGPRDDTIVAAHALCEAPWMRRGLKLGIGGRVADREQAEAARSRVETEVAEVAELLEATAAKAAPATATQAGDAGDGVLRVGVGRGSPEPRVVHLQNRLNSLGHRVNTDGSFGPLTQEAIKDFQARVGLKTTGEVDELTTDALRHGGMPRMMTQPLPDGVAPLPGMPAGQAQPEAPPEAQPTAVNKETPEPKAQPKAAAQAKSEKPKSRTVSLKVDLGEAVLTTKKRDDLDDSDFALPGRRYPIHDRAHAANALARVAQYGTPSEVASVRAAVKRKYPAMPSVEEADVKADFPQMQLQCAHCSHSLPAYPPDGLCPGCKRRVPMLTESAQTAALSVTHAPIGKGGRNWITATKPGNTGQLPAYIQNIRNAMMRDGKSESTATATAIAAVKRWAAGGGGVGPEVKAAAAKAVAEWEALKGKAHAKSAAKDVAESSDLAEDWGTFDASRLTGGDKVRVLGRSKVIPGVHTVVGRSSRPGHLILKPPSGPNISAREEDLRSPVDELATDPSLGVAADGLRRARLIAADPRTRRKGEEVEDMAHALTNMALSPERRDAIRKRAQLVHEAAFGSPPAALVGGPTLPHTLSCVTCGAPTPVASQFCQRGHDMTPTILSHYVKPGSGGSVTVNAEPGVALL